MRAEEAETAIGFFNEAALQPDLWPKALEQLSRAFGSTGAVAQMVGADGHTVLSDPGYEGTLQDYLEGDWATLNTRIERGLALTGRGFRGFITEYQMFSREELARDPFQQEFAPRHGMEAEAGIVLTGHAGASFVLTTPRGARAGPYSADELEVMNRLAERLVNTCSFALRLKLVQAQSILDAAAARGEAMALMTASGASLFHTAAFENLLGNGLTLRAGRVHAAADGADRDLQALIAKTANWSAADAFDLQPVVVKRPLARSLVVRCQPVAGAARDFLGLARIILVVDDLARKPAPVSADILRQAFGLSSAEARLTVRLASGETLREAAEAEGISYETSRSRLKQVFVKTETTRQTDLAILVSRLGG